MTSERPSLRHEEPRAPLVGPEVFELVTNAMYDQPLAMYREYIQNSADALMATKDPGDNVINVSIDPVAQEVTIRDNGSGLSHEQAFRALLPIGRSEKRRDRNVGFRGVGRLAGLAFAETVSFATRSREDSTVTVVEWNGSQVRERVRETGRVERAIHDCVTVKRMVAESEPTHFFEVRITGIHRFAAGTILNSDAVRTYISEVCPVPIKATFPFCSNLEQLFEGIEPPTTLDIYICDDDSRIVRPFGEDIWMSAKRRDRYTDLEVVRVPAVDRSTGLAAIGWIAHSSYMGAIPKIAGIRGIRARIGNIQIGDESVFDHLFPQARFNRWCIGEVHILDSDVVPNGRRDYFEFGPHTRNLENHLSAVCRRIVTRCRRTSRKRNTERRVMTKVTELEACHSLASSGYLRAEDATRVIKRAMKGVYDIRKESSRIDGDGWLGRRIDSVAELLAGFEESRDHDSLGDLPASQVAAYREVFGAVASVAKTGGEALRTIETIVQRVRARRCPRASDGATASGAPMVAPAGVVPSASSNPRIDSGAGPKSTTPLD